MTRNRDAPCQISPEARPVPWDTYAQRRIRVGVVLAFLLLCACTMEVQACEISKVLGFSTDSFTASLEAMEVIAIFGIAAATGKLAEGWSLF